MWVWGLDFNLYAKKAGDRAGIKAWKARGALRAGGLNCLEALRVQGPK